MFRIQPSLSEAQLLSFLKAGFLLYSNYHLHDNAPWVYKPLTLPCIPLFPLFFPQLGAYHYIVHTGAELNAKRMIRINRVGFSFQTLLVLQSFFRSSVVLVISLSLALAGDWYLSVRELGVLKSPFPFSLTSLLAPLILSVSVYKVYTF